MGIQPTSNSFTAPAFSPLSFFIPSSRQAREAAVEDFRMSIAADRIDAAMAMLDSLDPQSVSR